MIRGKAAMFSKEILFLQIPWKVSELLKRVGGPFREELLPL